MHHYSLRRTLIAALCLEKVFLMMFAISYCNETLCLSQEPRHKSNKLCYHLWQSVYCRRHRVSKCWVRQCGKQQLGRRLGVDYSHIRFFWNKTRQHTPILRIALCVACAPCKSLDSSSVDKNQCMPDSWLDIQEKSKRVPFVSHALNSIMAQVCIPLCAYVCQ